MYKWLMGGLFFAACALAVVLMFTLETGPKGEQKQEAAMPEVTLDAAAAETIAQANCISCHGDSLQGGIGPNLQNIGAQLDEEALYKIITKGKGSMMPAFKDKLKQEEIANLAKWLAEKK
ncbi:MULTISPECIES: cytochrome c [unclassified Paenibacillus]|uniref:c-type cytochrome n=1 Tax=unclassified Paenibacillus TaxID=185978 RepID=UPI001C10BA88|nr:MULTISPECIES: cytochrome c [unclassified Paenibacillus]MBU5445124.1 cytochrome c [Paenibacillus sp. MSJ-34]CAH0122740.1 Cytochrome c-551 [Paenibacillus sp. CECT 9249]